MQTILGAGGAIGVELASALKSYTDKIRLVSRNPQRINDNDELFPADLTEPEQVDKAVEDSDIVYLTAGLKYDKKVWKRTWPVIMENVISACKKHNAKLVFFDNMYMYDKDHLADMTEHTPVNPSSEKGKIRAQIAKMLMDEVKKGNIQGLIARAPDFIGPVNSLFTETVVNNLKKGKKADWFSSVDKVHSFIHVSDAARATAILGNTPDAYNQVWHLPTTPSKLTMKEWIGLAAKELGKDPDVRVMPSGLMGFMGIFVPILREFKEMVYQYDRDYFFNSEKFIKKFDFKPSSPEESVRSLITALKE